MRVVFMGTTPFSCVVLKQLLDDGHNVVAVVTQPDRPFGRKKELKPSPVKVMALENNIQVHQPEKIRVMYDDVLALEPDLVVTCAYGQIVPKVILDAPKYGCVNVHASLLPKYRGGAPIHWSIIKGEHETGVTLMMMDIGMDSGDMLAKQSVSILPDDTMGDVEAKLMEVSKVLIHEDLPLYLNGTLKPQKQNEDDVTLAYTIQRDDEFVSFKRDVNDVYNHLRGLIPWPLAYGTIDGLNVKFHEVSKQLKQHNQLPGSVTELGDTIVIACVGGYIEVKTLQPAGKPKMSAKDISNGIGQSWVGRMFE